MPMQFFFLLNSLTFLTILLAICIHAWKLLVCLLVSSRTHYVLDMDTEQHEALEQHGFQQFVCMWRETQSCGIGDEYEGAECQIDGYFATDDNSCHSYDPRSSLDSKMAEVRAKRLQHSTQAEHRTIRE